MTHFINYGCLDKFQSAYLPGFSTETALLRVTNDILCSVNSGNLVLLVLLDLSSAFDTINHRLLLQRLSSEAGIQGAALQWIASYLAERSQRVIVGSASSEAVPLIGRVIERFQMGSQFFADDTQILNSFPPDPAVARVALQRLESCCVAVKAWMTSNRLKLNDVKTEALLCGPRARREQIGISAVQCHVLPATSTGSVPRECTQGVYPGSVPKECTQGVYPGSVPRECTQGVHPDTNSSALTAPRGKERIPGRIESF
ncbi:hypothetical protein C0Q70_10217 [Pomacea canaliculata]|uniref:Uncharacterized protein n=1 Tax=Pomacea canaliculata TaxID=400727 RepID=A0A2T7PC05_POMCA|nr:hypothetical protein C0Q70_10217 [Pomacea canaliculata]